MTMALVGLLPPEGDECDMLDCSDPDVLAVVPGLLDPALAKHHQVDAVKNRYSRTVGYEYMSNGCVHCDALLGAFPLREEVTEVVLELGVAGLARLDSVDVPVAVFDRLLAAQYGELGESGD
jgi:hypothetical protein